MLKFQIDEDILVRSPLMGDAEQLFLLIEENRSHLSEWLGYIGRIRNVQDAEEFIAGRLRDEHEQSSYELLIEYQGSIAGRLWISRLKDEENLAEISYWLAEDATGFGIMTRSCRTVLSWLFEDRRVNRVEIRAAASNHKSRAVPGRLGFTLEGYLRDGTVINGVYHDEAVYSMLSRELSG